jgi:hypothetical protein
VCGKGRVSAHQISSCHGLTILDPKLGMFDQFPPARLLHPGGGLPWPGGLCYTLKRSASPESPTRCEPQQNPLLGKSTSTGRRRGHTSHLPARSDWDALRAPDDRGNFVSAKLLVYLPSTIGFPRPFRLRHLQLWRGSLPDNDSRRPETSDNIRRVIAERLLDMSQTSQPPPRRRRRNFQPAK